MPSTLTVTSLADSGGGSLRAEIAAANSGDTIVFAPSLAGQAITLTSGELAINTSIDIEGPGANRLTISGGNVSRVFDITASNASVTIAGLTVANGRATGGMGGGIYDAGGTLTLDHSTLSGNEAHGYDGIVYQGIDYPASSAAGGGLYVAGGMVHVNQSTFSNNRAVGGTGTPADACFGISGGYGGRGEGGGLNVAGGTVSIDNSTFSGNHSIGGQGGASGGDCPDAPYPNSGLPGGDGGDAAGGAIRVAAGTVAVRYGTLSGNGVNAGAGDPGSIDFPPGVNGVGRGGGISGGLQMYDTILAGNTTSDVAPDLDGTLTSLGHNLIGNSSGGSGFAATDLLNVNPRLGPLQNNGGPTQTMALLAGSPAINAGDNTGAPVYDQRGPGFTRIVGGAIDIGAFEVQTAVAPQASSFAVSGFPASTTAGVAGNFAVTAKNADGTTATGYTGTVHFSSSDGQAGFPADYTFTAADQGVHTFSATLKTAGTQSITAKDTATGTIAGSEVGITVTPAAASSVTVTGLPSTTTAGVAGNFTVTLKDTFGNIASGYTGTVHFTSSDGKASLPANYTFTAADAGKHTFSATLKTAGTQSITATDTATASLTGTEGGITVNPAAASKLFIGAPVSVTAGAAFSLTVTVQDAYGNVVTGYTGTIHFSSSDSSATLPANYTFTAADKGVHTFIGLVLRKKGNQKLSMTDTLHSALTGSVIENVL